MTLARYQFTVTDDEGNVIPAASVEVRVEATGARLAVLYSDRNGTTPMGNPFAADGEGFAAFHVAGGAYRITATSGAFTRTFRYVAVGLAQESDSLTTGISYLFATATAAADPGSGLLRLNNAAFASVTSVYIDNLNSAGADLSAWLASLDDGGSASDRGNLLITSQGGTNFVLLRLTGSVVDNTGWRTLSVTVLGSAGAFAADEVLSLSFQGRGVDGVNGTMTGPGANTVNGQFAVFSSSTGTALRGEVDGGSPSDPVMLGTDADVQAATPGRLIQAGSLRTASVAEALTDAATVAVPWDTFIFGDLIMQGNRILGVPTGAMTGTFRNILVRGNDATDRTLTFASAYGGEVPVITDADSGRFYLLTLFCVSASSNLFAVSSKRVFG